MRNSLSGQICYVSSISARQKEIKWPNWPGSELNFGSLTWKFGFFFKTCSESKLQIWPFYLILTGQNGHKWSFGSIWGVRKWSQIISHTWKPGFRYQNQVSMLRTKLTNLAILSHFAWPENGWNASSLTTQINLRCLEMVPNGLPYPTTWH